MLLMVKGPTRMIDVVREKVFPLREAPSSLPRCRAGRKTHVATLFRWASKGLRGIRLETIKVGGSTCTSAEALQRFFERLTEPESTTETTPQATAARQLELERVDRELGKLGV